MTHTRRYEYPNVYTFMMLLIFTVFTLLVAGSATRVAGLLLLMWGALALARSLWMLEIIWLARHFDQNSGNRPLPRTILSAMDERNRKVRGLEALRIIDGSLFLVVLLAFAYLVLAGLSSFGKLEFAPYQALQRDIADALAQGGNKRLLRNADYHGHMTLTIGAGFILPALAFWLAQTYAYSRRNVEMLSRLMLVLFSMSVLVNIAWSGLAAPFIPAAGVPVGVGWANTQILSDMALWPVAPLSSFTARIIENGVAGVLLLYALGIVAAVVMLRGLLQRTRGKHYPLGGLALLAALALCDMMIVKTELINAVWVSGWTVAGLLWVRAGYSSERSYRLRLL